MRKLIVAAICFLGALPALKAQDNKDAMVQSIVQEERNNSQLKQFAHELFDSIGPRLVGSPQMEAARDWALAKYKSFGIPAEEQDWGIWRGWERGVSRIDMVYPRLRTLEATQLAWCPAMRKPVTAELVIIPDLPDSVAFAAWLPNVKGKFVMVSMLQPTGRPDDNWQQFATPASFDKMKADRKAQTDAWTAMIKRTGCEK